MTDKEIKEHVKNVDDTIKITRAMQVIATTKIYSRQSHKDSSFRYLEQIEKIASLAMDFEKPNAKWFNEAKSDVSAYIVIAGDKGLCGDYNQTLLSFADKEISGKDGKVKLFLVGYMGIEHFKDADAEVDANFVYHQLSPDAMDSQDMTRALINEFLSGEFKDLSVIYTDVGKYGETTPVCKKILPLEYTPSGENHLRIGDDNDTIFGQLVFAKIYNAVVTASLAVNFKRMAAMRQATTNGEEMIEDLRLQLNKSRQEKITNELIDAIAVTFGKTI